MSKALPLRCHRLVTEPARRHTRPRPGERNTRNTTNPTKTSPCKREYTQPRGGYLEFSARRICSVNGEGMSTSDPTRHPCKLEYTRANATAPVGPRDFIAQRLPRAGPARSLKSCVQPSLWGFCTIWQRQVTPHASSRQKNCTGLSPSQAPW